jgi:hypothetical protein
LVAEASKAYENLIGKQLSIQFLSLVENYDSETAKNFCKNPPSPKRICLMAKQMQGKNLDFD